MEIEGGGGGEKVPGMRGEGEEDKQCFSMPFHFLPISSEGWVGH